MTADKWELEDSVHEPSVVPEDNTLSENLVGQIAVSAVALGLHTTRHSARLGKLILVQIEKGLRWHVGG